MHVRLEIEFGSDALDGPTVMAARRQVMNVVSSGFVREVNEGGFQVGVEGSPFPVDVRYRVTLLGPGEERVLG